MESQSGARVSPSWSPPAGSPSYVEPGNPKRGRAQFAVKRCNGCHAVAGPGGIGGPDLGVQPHDLVRSVPEVAGLMWNHSQGMAAEFRRRRIPRVAVSAQEMVDIITYFYFLNSSRLPSV